MAGHISYPRTAAAQQAWADYRDAITLANVGADERARSLLRAVLVDPNASPYLKQLAAEMLTRLNSPAIAVAIQSPDEGTRLEGKTAQLIIEAGFNIVSFNREIDSSGAKGEIDIETQEVIVETTIKKRVDKFSQLERLISSEHINPHDKSVILYAPNYRKSGLHITSTGAHLARTPAGLIALIQTLKAHDG